MRVPYSLALVAVFATGCATLPGADYPKQASTALAQPELTPLGRQVNAAASKHPGVSGLRLLPQGRDALRARAELAAAAERTLDLQYFIIQDDSSGKLLMDAVLHAADRGVRVRMLVDDTEDLARDTRISALAAHPGIEIRIFNPFYSRGVFDVLRYGEFLLAGRRLNSRMHNKLFIADNAAAVLGGRNIGDEYFQASTQTERADFDVLTVGPLVKQISKSFDSYWNSNLAIPIQALLVVKPAPGSLDQYRADLAQNQAARQGSAQPPRLDRLDLPTGVAAVDGSLIWAKAEVLYDDPEKSRVEAGEQQGRLLRHRLGEVLRTVKSELLVISPYLVPGEDGMRLLDELRARGVRVRVLTNSLAATDMPIVHAGYRHYRTRILEDGVELYEVRPLLGKPDGGGEHLKSASSGQFAVHAKVFVLDRERLFVGSMNFDHRSLRLNTEIGLLIDSPQLARQVAQRFEAMVQPANCYQPRLGPPDALGKRELTWRTEENGKIVDIATEPSGDLIRGIQTDLLTLLPIDDLL